MNENFQVPDTTFSVSPAWSARPTTGCGASLASLWVYTNICWQTVKKHKLAWFGYVTRHDSLSKPIQQGTLDGRRHRDRQRICWMDNTTEWTSLPMPELLITALCRKDRQRISAELSLMSPLTAQSVKGLN